MNKIILETNNLKKSFSHTNGAITLFENLNIKIKEGELVALVGPSGTGKSSLLHLLALLDEPSKGKIFVNTQDTNSLSSEEKDKIRRKNISMIFQDNNLLTDFNAIENVMMPLIIKGENSNVILSKAKKILSDLKILDRTNHFPNQLSGGEQQRVAIARAIVKDPKVLLADEPTGNLDPNISMEILELLDMATENGTSVIMCTHNYPLIKYKKRNFLELSEGKIR